MNNKIKQYTLFITFCLFVFALSFGLVLNQNKVTYSSVDSKDTKQIWNMHFNNVNFVNTSVKTENISGPYLTKSTSMEFSANLNSYDVIDFTFNIVNDGNVDAVLSDYYFLDTNSNENVSYSIKYLSGDELKNGDIIEANSNVKVFVSINANDKVLNEKHDFILNFNYYQKQ